MAPRGESPPEPVPAAAATDHDDVSVIYLIRHGDRFDYANPSWLDDARKYGALPTDPPLSALGHRQARETAEYLLSAAKKRHAEVGGGGDDDDDGNDGDASSGRGRGRHHGISKILVSPYLRVIQTACPTSDALGLPLCIEEGLSEAHATPGSVLPSGRDRFASGFPQVDPTHVSHLRVTPTPGYVCPKTGHPCEAFAGRYVERMGRFARQVETLYRGRSVVCFSHAASVALVAAFLRCTMSELKFAPCGVYELRRRGDGPWELVTNGEYNAHVSENSPTTYPWGFGEKHFLEEEDDAGRNGGGKRYFGSSEGIGLEYFVE